MNVLYIEDDLEKIKHVKKTVGNINSYIDINIKNSYTSGIIQIRKYQYDLILLDMSLPLYDTEDCDAYETNDFETFAGIDILEEIKRLKYDTKVIIITAFDIIGDRDNKVNLSQLDMEMKKKFPNNYLSTIHYDTSSLEWSNILKKLINMNYKI